MIGLLIKNVSVLTPSGVRDNMFIAAEGGVFTHVGDKEPLGEFNEVIDGKNCLAVPGLVNAHTHVAMTLFRSYADGLPLHEWLFEKVFPVEDRLTRDDVYWGSMLGIAEMLASGVTAFADMYFFMDAVADAVLESGIRANLSRGLMCDKENGDLSNDERLLENISLFKEYNNAGEGRIKIYFGPHAVYTCAPPFIRAVAEAARGLGTGVHIHLSETERENEECVKKHGKTPTQVLAEAGAFDVPAIAAHCVHLTEGDMEILARKGVLAVYNPTSNMKLSSGFAKVKEMAAAGVNLAIGTDGAGSNNNLNMVEEMHIAALLSGMGKHSIINMATNAAALGFGGGEIAVGKGADLALVDMSAPHFYPNHDPAANLVYSAQAADVKATVVAGKVLYRKGEYKTIDIERVIHAVGRCADRLFG